MRLFQEAGNIPLRRSDIPALQEGEQKEREREKK